MKLLYLSCHAILEYDELKLFEELGIDYFALGSYIDPQNPVDKIRPPLAKKVDEDLLHRAPDRNSIPKEFFDEFDVIMVMHVPEWIEQNWENMKHKRVIWRTIGQSTASVERRMKPYRDQGMQVVRYSKREINILDNIGCDALIRFYKDPDEFTSYNGINREIITFTQNMKQRGEWCNYDVWMKVAEGLPMKIYGKDNENMGELFGGFLNYQEMKQKMRDSAVYFYTGTQPASYTLNFIEAMMTGIPMVCIGSKFANSLDIAGDVYEIPDIIINGSNGFWSESVDDLRQILRSLLNKPSLAKYIGQCGRETAIQLFGKENIKLKWKEFLNI